MYRALTSLHSVCAYQLISSSGNELYGDAVIHGISLRCVVRSNFVLIGLSRQTKKPSTWEGFFRMEPVIGFEPMTY